MVLGKQKRLNRIFRDDGRTVIVPMDHGVTLGPISGIVDMQTIATQLIAGGADAIILHKGIAKQVDTGRIGLIIHASANTKLGPDAHCKVKVCSVEDAIRLGGDALSLHINVGASREPEMLSKLGEVAGQCDSWSIPLLAMMYPRGPRIKDENDPELVAHAARLGAELGADVVKTNYTGSIDTFRNVVRGCPVPVVIAGGPRIDTTRDLLAMVEDAVAAGCAGVSIGRNVFQSSDPTAITRAIVAIVHKNVTAQEALRSLGEKA